MIQKALVKVVEHINLSETEMSNAIEECISGKATPAQIGAFLTALRIKGETIEEITAAAKIMRKKGHPLRVSIDHDTPLVDTCGTGGDTKGTFNISTVSAFVIAGTGVVKVAKHGNRSVTSSCGSADLMQGLGVNLDVPIGKIVECIEKIGFGFFYAPIFHSAMKYVANTRKELGIKTIFNLLGPLTNPAMAPAQCVGVFDSKLTKIFAMVLKNLGCKHALIVHGSDGLDEITITGRTKVTELLGNGIRTYYIHPADFGMKMGTIEDLKGGKITKNIAIARKILHGKRGIPRDIVLLNSAAGLIASGKAKDFSQGIKMSADSIDSGRALRVLQDLIKLTSER